MSYSKFNKWLGDFVDSLVRARFLIYFVFLFFFMSFHLGEYCDDCYDYVETAYFFRGACSLNDLVAPYCYRILPSLITAMVPFQPEMVYPLMNVVFMWLGVLVLHGFFRRVGFSGRESFLGVMLYIFSFPVFWYAPYAVTDPSAMFFRIAGIYLGFTSHYILAGLSALVGVHARQDLLAVPIMLAVFYYWQKKYRQSEVMIVFLLAGMASLAVVVYAFRGAPVLYSYPTVLMSWADQKYFNFHMRAVYSLVLGIGPVGGLAFFALFARDPEWSGPQKGDQNFLFNRPGGQLACARIFLFSCSL